MFSSFQNSFSNLQIDFKIVLEIFYIHRKAFDFWWFSNYFKKSFKSDY